MKEKYKEYKQLDLTQTANEILKFWEEKDIFKKSLETRKGNKSYIFFEGPPSANGKPGIHHVMARAIKDIFCRYNTLKGFYVERKAGWDTHGLPVEIEVEKKLGITKDDIGKTISIVDYNKECRKAVMQFKDLWDDITLKMGFWVDLNNPYITFDNKYIESVWFLLKSLYNKGLLYKGYSIQPYSPAAGTGLSSHELNLPGCYKMVKDNTVVAQFKVRKDTDHIWIPNLFNGNSEVYILAWTTTPWTLPSNTALAVGKNIDYIVVKTYNTYTHLPITVILAKVLLGKYFPEKNASLLLEDYVEGQKDIPFKVINTFKGNELLGLRYEQLLPYSQPETGDAFKVVAGDFVTTEDGTGIVHIAPSFGADDFRTARQNELGSLTMVDLQGKFIKEMGEFAGRYVKPEFDSNFDAAKDNSVDVDIIIKLKKENKAFKTEKYEHSYPHCWRTDKPILYYPLDSWFIKTTACKERMLELNKTINWKPEFTGSGRFANWLENLVDWNLSRTRYWGVPLPIWMSEDKQEQICIGSAKELLLEIEKSIEANFMTSNPFGDFKPEDFSNENYNSIDLHRPYVDEIVLVSASGKKMLRERDLIDVWFDSGSMPYAQFHFPFENTEQFKNNFPADFIAEGVDQTRGWFFTLHAIAVMLFDSVAFKNVVSNGLVLDKNGNKMSKRLGNGVNPFEIINKYGPDATRWYMITNSQPWDNLKFDSEGIVETQRKFFGTLYNIYTFFVLYANIDNFDYSEAEIPVENRPEIDRWIISELNTLIQKVDEFYSDYEPTKAGRAIESFVDEYLSNWYVRLCRRRFWKGSYSEDKISAYQTLYTCIDVICRLASPIAPFFMDKIFTDLNNVTNKHNAISVHLSDFPVYNFNLIDKTLEERMELAQKLSSMVLSLRKKSKIRVRQPLNKIMIPVLDDKIKEKIEDIKELILNEVNVKQLEYLTDTEGILIKKIKPDFKKLGPKYSKLMKLIANQINQFNQIDISKFEKDGKYNINIEGNDIELILEDVEIISEDIPGWTVSNVGNLTIALDITINDELKEEGIARELVNRIQNLRKDNKFEVTDKISLQIESNEKINSAVKNNYSYICNEILAKSLVIIETIEPIINRTLVEIDDQISTNIFIEKIKD